MGDHKFTSFFLLNVFLLRYGKFEIFHKNINFLYEYEWSENNLNVYLYIFSLNAYLLRYGWF